MTVPFFGILIIGLVSAGVGAFLFAVHGFKNEREPSARLATVGGFTVFAVILVIGIIQYWVTGGPYRYIALPVAIMGVVLSVLSVQLVLRAWARSGQLAAVMAAFFMIVLPFEFGPAVHIFAQEWFAGATVNVLSLVGAEATVETTASGHLTLVCLGNSFCVEVTRECNAIYVGALLSAFPLAARTSIRKKIGGFVFVAVATGVVNLFRLVIVGLSIAYDLFGPFFTDVNTALVSYFFAELVLNQFIIAGATVVGFLVLDMWIPDILAFIDEWVSEMRDICMQTSLHRSHVYWR